MWICKGAECGASGSGYRQRCVGIFVGTDAADDSAEGSGKVLGYESKSTFPWSSDSSTADGIRIGNKGFYADWVDIFG